MLNKIKCILTSHEWSHYKGFYQEIPTSTAICSRCGAEAQDHGY